MANSSYEQITVAATAASIASGTRSPSGRNPQAKAFLETAPIRYRTDGTAPTSTTGHLMQPGDTLILETLDEITNFQAIRSTSTSGTLTVTVEHAP